MIGHSDRALAELGGAAPARARPSRMETLLILGLTALAAWLRLRGLDTAGIGQYDEGVYAFTGLGLGDASQPHRVWPGQERFAPPVYFSLVAIARLLSGLPSDVAAILVNVVLGTLTVPLVWWITRRWLSAGAAMPAAALVALSEFHILMSRTALTDVTFTFVFLIALAAMAWALAGADRDAALGRGIVAGLAVGLAWNTKYHGWFALVIAAAAIVATRMFGGTPMHVTRRMVRIWVASAITAGLTFVPWGIYIVTSHGSVNAWSTNYARMITINVFATIWRHAGEQLYLDGALTRASVLVALVLAAIWSDRRSGEGAGRRALYALGIAASAFFLGGTATTLLLAVIAVPTILRRPATLPGWFLIGWIGLWIAAAPLYRPYFRLLLPFTVAGAMAAGAALAALATAGPAVRRTLRTGERLRAALPAIAAGVLAVAVWAGVRPRSRASDPWRPSRGMADAATRIAAALPPSAPVVVVAEPPLAFYLHTQGHAAFGDLTNFDQLDSLPDPSYIVTGVYTRRAPIIAEAIRTRADRLELLGRFPLDPTDVRLLDDFTPADARRYRARPDSTYDLLLYRLRGPSAAGTARADTASRRPSL
jgi:dolichyl-phosphate-mannose-protein mannosyltransferase